MIYSGFRIHQNTAQEMDEDPLNENGSLARDTILFNNTSITFGDSSVVCFKYERIPIFKIPIYLRVIVRKRGERCIILPFKTFSLRWHLKSTQARKTYQKFKPNPFLVNHPVHLTVCHRLSCISHKQTLHLCLVIKQIKIIQLSDYWYSKSSYGNALL